MFLLCTEMSDVQYKQGCECVMSEVGERRVELNQEERKITESRNILITDKWRCRPIAVRDLKNATWLGGISYICSLFISTQQGNEARFSPPLH